MATLLKGMTEKESQKARLKHPGVSFETNPNLSPIMIYIIIAVVLVVLIFLLQ